MTAFIDALAYRWKAIAAFLAPAVAILAAPMTSGHAPTVEDYWMALGAALLTAFAVERVGNRPLPGDALVDPRGVAGVEQEGVEFADTFVADVESGEPPRPAVTPEPGEHRKV